MQAVHQVDVLRLQFRRILVPSLFHRQFGCLAQGLQVALPVTRSDFPVQHLLVEGQGLFLVSQYALLKSVCDTISAASHLLLLHHHAISLDVPGIPHPWKMANWPYLHWDANCHDPDPSYTAAIYPLLLQVKARGIEVVNVMGDTGFKVKKIEAVSKDGIHYLASGIDNSRYARDPQQLDTVPKDLVLIFQHHPQRRTLQWQFHDLDSLLRVHPGG